MINKFIYLITALVTLALLICCFTGMGIMLCEQRQQALTLELEQIKHDLIILNERVKEHEEIMATYQFFNEKWTKQMMGER